MADGIDIEWVVREVVRRLREQQGKAPSDGGAEQYPQHAQHSAGELEIADRVVTLEILNKRLSGIDRLVVAPRAIVTPAVIDELRDRGIALVRGASEDGKKNGTVSRHRQRPLVVVAVENFESAALAKLLGSGVAVINHPWHDGTKILGEITEHIDRNTPAVLLTSAPVTAVVQANRNPRVRAAVGFNFPAVRQAVDEAGANLLAVDPAGRTMSEIAGMVGEFVKR